MIGRFFQFAGVGGSVGLFFGLKVAVGVALLAASARHLPIEGFVRFSQLFLYLAMLAIVSAGGVQFGLIRQVAAADGDRTKERITVLAALRIWAAFSAFSILLTTVFRSQVSILLIGTAESGWLLPWLALAASGGGGGILLCSLLTGRGRIPMSLGFQSVGLVVGGAASLAFLMAGNADAAVLGYAAGPLVTAALAFVPSLAWLGRLKGRSEDLRSEVRTLSGYSAAFLISSVIMPTTLFVLRYIYREQFGAEALGYWLAANRVSDVTTQLLGLYMGQVFLPAVSRATYEKVRPILRWTFLAATLLMSTGLLVFVLGANFFVNTFLSPQFIPAIPFIIGYLAGDVLRVVTSITLHLALARKRLFIYVVIEVSTAALLFIYVYSFILHGISEGAYFGYIAAYATLGAIILMGGRPLVRAMKTLARR